MQVARPPSSLEAHRPRASHILESPRKGDNEADNSLEGEREAESKISGDGTCVRLMLDDGECWIQIPPCGPRVHSFKKRNKFKDTAAEGLKRAGAFFYLFSHFGGGLRHKDA